MLTRLHATVLIFAALDALIGGYQLVTGDLLGSLDHLVVAVVLAWATFDDLREEYI